MYLKEIPYNRLELKLNRAEVKQNAEKLMYFLIISAKFVLPTATISEVYINTLLLFKPGILITHIET